MTELTAGCDLYHRTMMKNVPLQKFAANYRFIATPETIGLKCNNISQVSIRFMTP